MALLSIEAEMARAVAVNPFPDSADFERWMQLWCQDCVHEVRCPLLLLVVLNRTPAPWEPLDPGAVNRYSCTEYEEKADG